jgi:hypothetical protein
MLEVELLTIEQQVESLNHQSLQKQLKNHLQKPKEELLFVQE